MSMHTHSFVVIRRTFHWKGKDRVPGYIDPDRDIQIYYDIEDAISRLEYEKQTALMDGYTQSFEFDSHITRNYVLGYMMTNDNRDDIVLDIYQREVTGIPLGEQYIIPTALTTNPKERGYDCDL